MTEAKDKQALSLKASLLLALAVLSSFALRVYLYHTDPRFDWSSLIYHDERHYYLAGAKLLLEQGWEYFLTERSLWNGPLSILPLALVNLKIGALKLFHLLLLSLVGGLIWDVARRRFGLGYAWLAFFISVAHAPFYVFGPTILSESLFTFLITLSLWTLTVFARSNLGVLASGIILGLACFVRPTPQYFPLLLLGLYVLQRRREFLVLALGCALVVLPWIAKNAYFFGKAGIATGSGAVLYLGNDLRKDGDEPVFARMDFDTAELTKPLGHLDVKGDRILSRAALEWVKEYPIDIAHLTVRKFFRLVFGTSASYFFPHRSLKSIVRTDGSWKGFLKVTEVVLTVGVSLLGLFYWIFLAGNGAVSLIFAALLAYFYALHSVAFAIPRMMLPVFPVLCVGAVGSVRPLLSFRKNILLGILFLAVWIGASIYILKGDWIEDVDIVSSRTRSYFSLVEELPLAEAAFKDIELRDGLLVPTGEQPSIEFRSLNVALLPNQVLFFDIQVAANSIAKYHGQLHWASKGQGFSDRRSTSFTLYADNVQRTNRVSPSLNRKWLGTIDRLEIRFPANPDLKYQIENISIRK